MKLPPVGTLVARVEAPTVLYRVTSNHVQYARALPFQRQGKEVFLMTLRSGRKSIIAGDGSEWQVKGVG